ncbi:MAG: type II secretion system F family protein [Candidatus Diapherotrites archaeon]|nr:type II secretion system F family protein [Candidatus Diapherotrites archaeon]
MEKTLIEKYSEWMEFSKMKYPAAVWIALSLVLALALGMTTYVIISIVMKETSLLPLAVGLATGVLILGYPYMKKESIINSMEKNFSDALKEMGDTLKAGDTYESALREVAESDYGRLSEEMGYALRRLEDGENLENALRSFSEKVDSTLIKRTITIMLDSIRTGASLAEILDEISEDVHDFQRLKEERKTNTTMQFLFMIAAGGIIAPLIFGEINAVIAGFSSIGSQTLSAEQLVVSKQIGNQMLMLIQLYLIVEVIGSGTMMSLIREGKLNKSIIYIPLLLLLAFITYYVSMIMVGGMLLGPVS